MALLDHILEAHGGIDRWRDISRFTVHFSMNGSLLGAHGRRGVLKDLLAEGLTQGPSLRLVGFPAIDRYGRYRPDAVSIEITGGISLETRLDPGGALRMATVDAPWDDLHLTYYCGAMIWNCLAAPFLLASPGTTIEELGSWCEGSETWQRLRIIHPDGSAAVSRKQISYFDVDGLQRRTDCAAIDRDGVMIAQYSQAHQEFSGITVPTLHRGLVLQPDGVVVRKPSRLDIEIFDVQFE